MAIFTLAEAVKLGLDDLQSGIAETIVTNAPALALLPFQQVSGNAYSFNREATLVNGQSVAADGTITDSSALTNTLVHVSLTAISGQSDIPNAMLRQNIGVNGGNDIVATHLRSAAKGVSREFLRRMVDATVGVEGFDGLVAILGSAAFTNQVEDAAGGAFSFDLVDSAIARLGGRPDYLMGNAKAENKFRKLMRAAGGVTSIELNGQIFSSYEGIPFVRNDWIADGDLFIGTWGDGTNLGGATALTTGGDLFSVTQFDALEGKDATRVRVIMDGAFTVYSPKQIAMVKDFI